MDTAVFQYKCRLCGEVFDDAITSPENAQITLICTVTNKPMPEKFIGIQPEMIELHAGCKKGYGVADLIGYVVQESEIHYRRGV